jgi:hypothetical protein
MALKPHLGLPNPVSSFFFRNRTRREIALYTFGMYSGDMAVLAPYLDEEVYDLLMSLPGEMLADGRFHTEAIARAFPEAAKIPYGLSDDDKSAAQWQRGQQRRHFRRLSIELGSWVALGVGDKLISKRFLLPRLAVAAAMGSTDHLWFDVEKVIWLTQCDREARRGGSSLLHA